MSKARIEVNFEELKRLSEELMQTAKRIKQEMDNTGMEIISATKVAWISPGADKFVGKEVKTLERIGEISMDLSTLSQDIYDKAKIIYEIERGNILLTQMPGHVFI